MRGLGGAEATRNALDWFRKQAIKAGLPGLHLQMTMWGERNFNLSGVDGDAAVTTREIVKILISTV